MTIQPKNLVSSQQITNVNAQYYSANNVYTIIDDAQIVNTSASAVLVTVYLVNSGGGADSTSAMIYERAIASGETYSAIGIIGETLNPGQSIWAKASDNTSITFRVSGREVSGA